MGELGNGKYNDCKRGGISLGDIRTVGCASVQTRAHCRCEKRGAGLSNFVRGKKAGGYAL